MYGSALALSPKGRAAPTPPQHPLTPPKGRGRLHRAVTSHSYLAQAPVPRVAPERQRRGSMNVLQRCGNPQGKPESHGTDCGPTADDGHSEKGAKGELTYGRCTGWPKGPVSRGIATDDHRQSPSHSTNNCSSEPAAATNTSTAAGANSEAPTVPSMPWPARPSSRLSLDKRCTTMAQSDRLATHSPRPQPNPIAANSEVPAVPSTSGL